MWGGVASKDFSLLNNFMQTSFKISASDSASIFDALRKFSPIKYQQGGVGQEQNIEPIPPIPPIPPVPPNIEYEIGQFAQGGVVIWVTDDKQHGLVASIVNLSPETGPTQYTLTWGPLNTTTGATNNDPLPAVYTNPTPAENYSGYQNQKIIEALSNWEVYYPAFNAAAEYSITINGVTYNDWFLPTLTELQQIYNQRTTVTAVSHDNGGDALFVNTSDPGSSFYWSSYEFNAYLAWGFDFFNGSQYGSDKSLSFCAVRCVRAF